DAFVRDMLILKPDAVIISGDLTLNGAEESHRGFAEALKPLAKAGIKVFVIPGNHDTDGTAYTFRDGKTYQKDSIGNEDFSVIYSGLGYGSAISRDEHSLSYFGKVSDSLWVLMVDVNANDTFCTVKNETLKWMEENLKKARAEGIKVISSTHQPMMVHNGRFTFGYTVSNANKLLELYRKYGVELNLAGHLHIQHIVSDNGFTDIAASSMAVTPNQYGIISIKNNTLINYETKSVDVPSWAEENGMMLSSLLNFPEYSASFFDETTLSKLRKAIRERNLTEDEKLRLENIAAKINREYFGGKVTVNSDDEDWMLWQEKMDGLSFGSYMGTIVNEAPYDMTHLDFSVTK
ncbi:MAG: metallophosphoesterase, partial [Bullifex sp.]